MKSFIERWSSNRPAAIKHYLELVHGFNRQGQKKSEFLIETSLQNRNKDFKIRVTRSFNKIADKILDTAALMGQHFC